MKIAIRYYSKGGNTKRIAEAVSKAVGVEAKPVSEPLTEDIDILFLCAAPYKFNIDAAVLSFVGGIGVSVGKTVLFSTSASVKPIGKYLEKLFSEKRIALEKEEFYCPGKFLILHNGRPNEKDCEAAADFARKVIERGE